MNLNLEISDISQETIIDISQNVVSDNSLNNINTFSNEVNDFSNDEIIADNIGNEIIENAQKTIKNKKIKKKYFFILFFPSFIFFFNCIRIVFRAICLF